MGGGGDDGGYQQQQAATEAKKQKARDALNVAFGIAPTTAKPDASTFYTKYDTGPMGDAMGAAMLDQDAYGSALSDWQAQQDEAAKSKAARDTLYSTVRDNAFSSGKRRLDESKDAAGRDLKFELFAKGLNGGSVDVDQNALLGRTYNQGVLDLGSKADSAKAELRGSDEATRLNLLQSIDAGMDQGTALSSALNQMQVANDRASADATGTALGDVFGGAGLLYSDSAARKGQSLARQQYPWLFSTSGTGGSGSSRGATGSISIAK